MPEHDEFDGPRGRRHDTTPPRDDSRMRIDLHVHGLDGLGGGNSGSQDAQLTAIKATLAAIVQQGVQIMGTIQLAREALSTLNERTNEIAAAVGTVVASDQAEDDAFRADIQALKDQAAAGQAVTAADLDELTQGMGGTTATLAAVKAALEAMGSNPSNPIPPVDIPPVEPVP